MRGTSLFGCGSSLLLLLLLLLLLSLAESFLLEPHPQYHSSSSCVYHPSAPPGTISSTTVFTTPQGTTTTTIQDDDQCTQTTKRRRPRRTWEESFQLLIDYKDKHGTCNVPQHYKTDPSLGRWVNSQRHGSSSSSALDERKRSKLNAIGFAWSNELLDERWDAMLERLQQFAATNGGDCNIPQSKLQGKQKELCLWVTAQRQRRSVLSEERRTKLDQLGFTWENSNHEKLDQRWKDMYQRLIDYHRRHGNCNVPRPWDDDPSLARWVSRQRVCFQRGYLSETRQSQLDQLEFTWQLSHSQRWSLPDHDDDNGKDLQWNRQYKKLRSFVEEFGHCDVPLSYEQDTLSLGQWVARQRRCHDDGTLRQDREEILEDLGFLWSWDDDDGLSEDESNEEWNRRYQMLLAYWEEVGDCNVPRRRGEEDDRDLGEWVSRQRIYQTKGILRTDRKDRLDDIQFTWTLEGLPDNNNDNNDDDNNDDDEIWTAKYDRLFTRKYDLQWDRSYDRLLAFRAEHGHCNVTPRLDPNSSTTTTKTLCAWVRIQRSEHAKGALTQERKDLLEEIGGFTWSFDDQLEQQWREKYDELQRFYEINNGHFQFPNSSTASLKKWVYRQRIAFASGRLDRNRKVLLDRIDFDWDC